MAAETKERGGPLASTCGPHMESGDVPALSMAAPSEAAPTTGSALSSTSPSTGSCLLDLPAELRNQIWGLVFAQNPDGVDLVQELAYPHRLPALRSTCRQIHQETKGFFCHYWTSSTFLIALPDTASMEHALSIIQHADWSNASNITHLRVVHQRGFYQYKDGELHHYYSPKNPFILGSSVFETRIFDQAAWFIRTIINPSPDVDEPWAADVDTRRRGLWKGRVEGVIKELM